MKKIDKIDTIELFIVRLPLVNAFETSFSVQTHREAMLIKITSQGITAWGECVSPADPYYCYETNETAKHIIEDFLVPILTTMKNFSVEEVMDKFTRVRGHNMAKAAIENTLLNLLATREGIPLYQLLGGDDRKIMSGISIGIQDNLDELFKIIQKAVDKKYHRIKIKIKKGTDINTLQAIRKNFPDINLMADANADYSVDDLALLKQFDQFDLMMIEQPLSYDDIYFHSLLQKEMRLSICLDESIKNLNDAKTAVALNSCRIINIKQGRVGGLLHARAIQEFCRDNFIKVWSGGMLETGIGRACNIHLQTLPGFLLPGDTSETSRYFEEDIVDKPVVIEPDGFILIPEGIGIGVDVVPKKLEKYTIHHEKLL
jgi:O-succinylbenzoate synthase